MSERREPDVALGEDPFNGSCVGQCMLADEWIQWAIRVMEARRKDEG
jgi:hypothetical protein